MQFVASQPVAVRPHIGSRRIGPKLAVTNLKKRQIWVFSGSSGQIWERLKAGWTPERIADYLSTRYSAPAERTRADVTGFVEHLWQRQIVDIAGLEHVTDAERSALVKGTPHNRDGTFVRAASNEQVMFNCIFDLLVPCNLRCRHCYLDFSDKSIMPLAEVSDYLAQLAAHGCANLTLTGGEIFLRKDLLSIIADAEEKGFLTLLLTNGMFIDRKKADELSAHHLEGVQISIYGTTAATHDAVTKMPGTFDKSIGAARLLIERGVKVTLAYFLQHDNVEEAFEFPKFSKKLGAKCKFDTKLVPNRNGSKEPLQYAVTLEQMRRLYQAQVVSHETDFLCTAAIGKARITANADVFPCELINTASLGNLRRQSLEEMWSSRYRQQLRQEIIGYKPHRCGSCSHTSECEPCAAMRGFNQPKHMEQPVSEACFLTTASLLAKGQSIQDSGFLQKVGNECISSLLQDQASHQHSPLVQIMAARTASLFAEPGLPMNKAL
jgi:radical SAM protein with 4Fe4S-binding SPASM domain